MPYNPPDFNLFGDWWNAATGNGPSTGPPNHTNIPMQLYRNARTYDTEAYVMIRIDASWATVLQGPLNFTTGNRPFIECPQASGNYYLVGSLVWMHRGFPNEYIMALANPCTAAGAIRDSDNDIRVPG